MTFEDIFNFLESHGHKRVDLGVAMFGTKRWRNVYRLKMPTPYQARQLAKAKKIAEDITGEKMQ